jgi:hypothetical protein
MKHVLMATIALLVLVGCTETTTGNGGSGGAAGSGATGGTPPPPGSVDQTCRDWCANEPEGPSCHQGTFESVQPCYEKCLRDYQVEEEQRQCGGEWIAIKDCQLDLDCADLFGDCDPFTDTYNECLRLAENREYCEATCPELDPHQCAQDMSECRCNTRCPELDLQQCVQDMSECHAVFACATRCRMQDPEECVRQYLSTGECQDDLPDGGVI